MNRFDLIFLSLKMKFTNSIKKQKKHLSDFGTFDIPAISSIEMILLLLVLVSIVVIFRTQITSVVNSVFSKIKSQINDF